jgi:5'-methylthioadenosine phosphorylase
MAEKVVGVIGGSGLYEMEGLTDIRWLNIDTPFGSPSDQFLTGTMDGVRLVFLPRHGRGHRIIPSEINFRANIYGMKVLGVDWIISVGAVGSMREEIRPGDVVVIDQFFDRTKGRISTFFGRGIVAHVSFADPVCPALAELLYKAANKEKAVVHKGGTYLCIEGPQFSTRAESLIYRGWGVDVIGMTNLTEAKLAREAEICYATLAFATDYDCWHTAEESVTIDAVLKVLSDNVALAKRIVKSTVAYIDSAGRCHCREALKDAVITDKAAISTRVKKDLDFILGKYL